MKKSTMETTRQPKPSLTRDRILTSAMELADRDGLDALSMRRLAKALGVEAMSLYYHVANKEELLDGMVDRVFAEVELPSHEVDWRTAMRQRANSQREALLRHRWALSVMESRTAPGPVTLRHHDAVLGRCRAAGFSVEMSAHAFSLIDAYIYGFVLQEITLPYDDDNLEEMVDQIITHLPREIYPHLTELTVEHVLQTGYNYGAEFGFGLNIILAGLEAAAAGHPLP